MKLNLSENIKKYRKEMNLTQEELAEAFNVTVGAVSKWEGGSTVPDIMTMMELADFFNISMDVLLGYNLSSKSVDDTVKKIRHLINTRSFDEAMSEADKALARYPASFKIMTVCAELYYVLYTVSHEENDEYRKKAISLYEKSLSFFSQNDDPEISEFSIKLSIARLKRVTDPEGALNELYAINYMGVADIDIAKSLMDCGRIDEALDRYTRILFSIFIQSFEFSTSMANILACTDKKKNYQEAIELLDWNIKLIDMTTENKSGYCLKVKVILLALKAMFYSCLKEYTQMKSCLDKAHSLALKYDKDPSNDLSGKLKFWHAGDDFNPFAHDSLGAGAIESINAMFSQKPSNIQEKIVRKMDAAEKYWRDICR